MYTKTVCPALVLLTFAGLFDVLKVLEMDHNKVRILMLLHFRGPECLGYALWRAVTETHYYWFWWPQWHTWWRDSLQRSYWDRLVYFLILFLTKDQIGAIGQFFNQLARRICNLCFFFASCLLLMISQTFVLFWRIVELSVSCSIMLRSSHSEIRKCPQFPSIK